MKAANRFQVASGIFREVFRATLVAVGFSFLAGILATARADEPRVAFTNSIAPLPAAAAATMRNFAAPALTEKTMDFAIALRMRNFEAMQARIDRGAIIPAAELQRFYLPLPADWAAVRQWLVDQGFTLTQDDASRISVFARGTVQQIQASLQVGIVNVTVDGKDYAAANTAPSLPASVAAPVLGINGLQPYRRVRKHWVVAPQVANAPNYLTTEILGAFNAKNLGLTGNNQTIAILIDTVPAVSDVTSFWTNNSVPQSQDNLALINVPGGTLPATAYEETLDAEWTSGIAPGAKVRLYASGGLTDTVLDQAIARIISDLAIYPTIHQLSISLGGTESGTLSEYTTDNSYFATLASQGVSTFVSSGDAGSTPPDPPASTAPFAVEYYGSDPNVTAVGGTSLTLNTSTGAISSQSAWAGSGGGVSVLFAKPSWQTGTGVPAGTFRFVPDVCLPADPGTGAYVYYKGSPIGIGGTSWSTPTWAGLCALINERRATNGLPPLGLLNPKIYPLIGTANFFDITTGSNAKSASAGGKFAATVGYDEATGIGAPNVAALLTTLAGAPSAPAPTVTSISPAGGPVGTVVTVTGTNFSGVSGVSVDGFSAAYTVDSAAQLRVTVPDAARTGRIAVGTNGGSAISDSVFTASGGAHVVISQVYGGGQSSSATYASDYIELFNPGTTAVDISACSVQYAAATGTGWSTTNMPAGASIQPKRYYLVQEATGTGAAIPTPDATGSIPMNSMSGKVALVSDQTPLTGAGLGGAGVVDFVGYGSSASAYEGGGPTPTLSVTTAALRGSGGLADSDDNANDFTAGTPNPRNSSSPPTGAVADLTITKSHSGSFTQADAGDTYIITVTNTGAGPTTGTVTVTDALPAGLTAAALSGSGWTANLGSLTCTRSDALAGGASYPAITLTVNVSSTAAASLTNTATVNGGGETNTANDSASDPTTIIALTPSQSWRLQNFGTTANSGTAADLYIYANDGMSNLLKYGLNLNPKMPAVSPITVDTTTGYLRLTTPRNPAATDVTLSVEVSGDLAGWSAAGTTVNSTGASVLQVHDNTPVGAVPRFMHLRVSRP